MRLLSITALIVFVLDQVSKYLVVHAMDLKSRLSVDVLPPLLNFRMAWNDGINFGLLGGSSEYMRWVLIALALVITGAILIWIARNPGGRWVQLSAGLLVGGALGNVIDRVLYGAVADFLNMSCCGISNPFSYNVADIAVFAGAIGLVLFTGEKKST